jgi:hypothetical protein
LLLIKNEKGERMMAIAFRAVIIDNTIEIPEEYRGKISPLAMVTITDSRQAILPKRSRSETSPKTLSEPHIDTSGWKFNRDEANER